MESIAERKSLRAGIEEVVASVHARRLAEGARCGEEDRGIGALVPELRAHLARPPGGLLGWSAVEKSSSGSLYCILTPR